MNIGLIAAVFFTSTMVLVFGQPTGTKVPDPSADSLWSMVDQGDATWQRIFGEPVANMPLMAGTFEQASSGKTQKFVSWTMHFETAKYGRIIVQFRGTEAVKARPIRIHWPSQSELSPDKILEFLGVPRGQFTAFKPIVKAALGPEFSSGVEARPQAKNSRLVIEILTYRNKEEGRKIQLYDVDSITWRAVGGSPH